MRPKYKFNDKTVEVYPIRHANNLMLNVAGQNVTIEYQDIAKNRLELVVNEKRFTCYVAQNDNEIFIHLDDGITFSVQVIDEFAEAAEGVANSGSINAPMPGAVVEVPVQVGTKVSAGDVVMVIESMKLLVELKAPIDGVVTNVGYGAGDTFNRGAVLLIVAGPTEE